MIVNIAQYGPETYEIGFETGFSAILQVGQEIKGPDFSIMITEFMGIHGVEIRNTSGLYTKDIRGSGPLKLVRVEDEEGNMVELW